MLKSKVYILILVLTLSLPLFSQQKKDVLALITAVENTIKKTEKLYLLDSLSNEISKMRSSDFDFYKKNYAKYTLEYIGLAKALDSFDLAAFKTAKFTNYYLNIIDKPDSAYSLIRNSIKDSNKIKNKLNLAHLYLKQGGANFQRDYIEEAIIDYNNAQKIFHKTKDSIYEADAIYFGAQASERLGKLSEAVLKYQEANKLYIKLKDTSYIAYTGLAVSGIFSQMFILDKSFEERQKIRVLLNSQKNKDYRVLSFLNINDARDFVKKKEYKKQEEALLNAVKLLKKNEKDVSNMILPYSLLAEYYSTHNVIEKARKYIDTLEFYPNLINSSTSYYRTPYLEALGRLKKAEGKYNEAILIFTELINILKNSNDIIGQVVIEKVIHEVYKKTNQSVKALKHLDRHLALKDSIYSLTRSNSVIYYKTLYETEKRDNKIAIQEASINILEEKDKAKRNLLIFGGIGLSLVFLCVYLFRNRTLLMRNKLLQQSFLQELLQTQERISKRISKDLHDSVGQSLLLIKNRTLQNDDKQTAEIVDGVINEVRSISRSLHPFKLDELGLTVTLQSSVEMIDDSYDIFISAEIDNIDKVFDQDKEINIYRLVQESFNNILKHSNARSAEIKVINKDNNVEIIITDNGKGFDVIQEKTSMSKIGLKTLSERSKYLKANFKIFSEINQGTTLVFNIPKYG